MLEINRTVTKLTSAEKLEKLDVRRHERSIKIKTLEDTSDADLCMRVRNEDITTDEIKDLSHEQQKMLMRNDVMRFLPLYDYYEPDQEYNNVINGISI